MFFMAVVAQSFCYFPISVRGRRIVEPCIQPKHSAMLAAVIAAPHIFDEIDIHLTPTVATERAIHIDTISLLASDTQVQQFHDIHDIERKFIRV